jgi:hypothetical protein
MPIDVTSDVCFGNPDDESLPLLKCICGKKFEAWKEIVSIYPEHPWQCDECGTQLYFRQAIQVFRVT